MGGKSRLFKEVRICWEGHFCDGGGDDDGRREAAGDGRGGGGVPRGKSPNRLYVLGLPRHVTEVLLKEFFGRFGAVTDARVLASRDGEGDGGPRRGTVTFASAADAARARAETDNTRAFHGGGELKVIHSNLREGEGGRRGGGGGGGRGGGASAQPWSVYPIANNLLIHLNLHVFYLSI